MYIFKRAIVLTRSVGAQWVERDLRATLLQEIFRTYRRAYLELESIYLEDTVYVDLTLLRPQHAGFSGTLSEWLVSMANKTLPTVDHLPTTNLRYARYSDARQAAYLIEPVAMGRHYPPGYPITERPDLALTRPRYDTDMRLVHQYCLTTVNGYIHMTDAALDGSVSYIKDGSKSMLTSSENHVGILSFLDIAELTKIPITEPMVRTEQPLKKRVVIDLEEPIGDRMVLLSLGGYLLFPEEQVFWVSGEKTLSINLDGLPMLERFYESSLYLDLSELHLTQSQLNRHLVTVDEWFSDAVLLRYLQLSQTFVILVDTPTLLTEKRFIRHSSLPGMFTAHTEPVYPLVVNYGKLVEYWKTHEDGYWSVTVTDSYLRNFQYTHRPMYGLPVVTDHLMPNKTFYSSRGYFLEITGEVT